MEHRTAIENMSNYADTRGTLWTCDKDGKHTGLEAWFMLSEDGQRVIARKVRGRNRWHYCNAADVVQFDVTHY
jgi:hypothetical protein